MKIASNVPALNTWRQVTKSESAMNKALLRLSSGIRINTASDDPAGLAISEKMKAQISGLRAAARNAQDGISLVQTAEGALSNVQGILQRIKELAVQADSGTYSATDKAQLQTEVSSLLSEITHISDTTAFNNIKLLNGSTTTVTVHIGSGNTDTMTFGLQNSSTTSLAINTINVSTDAQAAISAVDAAIDTVSTARANLGATNSRLDFAIEGLNITAESLTAAKSRISDADMALEMAEFTKHQIILQSGIAMLAHANMRSQTVNTLFSK